MDRHKDHFHGLRKSVGKGLLEKWKLTLKVGLIQAPFPTIYAKFLSHTKTATV